MIKKLRSIADFVTLYKESFFGLHPVQIVLIGYGLYICFGWILLSLPFTQAVDSISSIDNLFIATSAVSTTGLVTVSVSDSYSLFGQIVVLLLIQLGGVGYMTVGSFVILSKKIEMSDLRKGISKTVFALPKSFKISKFIRSVGTVGLSRGITTELTNFGKIIIIILMYAGRLGPLSFGSALFISGFKFFREREGDSDIAV